MYKNKKATFNRWLFKILFKRFCIWCRM